MVTELCKNDNLTVKNERKIDATYGVGFPTDENPFSRAEEHSTPSGERLSINPLAIICMGTVKTLSI